MQFSDVLTKRKSIRKYKPIPVQDEDILRVLEAARVAPSASNRQPWHYVVVRDEATRKRVAGTQIWAAGAPVIIVAMGDKARSPNWWRNDVGISFEHVMLAAADIGLGTCWMGSYTRDEEIRGILGVPDNWNVAAITPLGYPDEDPPTKTRKPLDEIVSWERFGGKR